MIYLATNFGTVFDPSTTYSTDAAYVKTVNRTGIRDSKLYQLAVDMRKTEPGDVLSYCQKWVAFQERWTEVLPRSRFTPTCTLISTRPACKTTA